MTTVINTNLASLFAQNSLSNAQNNLATSVQRLSSGLRINTAKDDAAGLAIAQNMQGQINGVNQSIRNLSDATNLLQTADSSLSTVQDMLLRMKQLAVQGYNGSLNVTQKDALVTEMTNLNDEINATAQRTSFNGVSLLASGTGIDAVTGGISSGKYLTSTAPAILSTATAAGVSTTSLVVGASGTLDAVNSLGNTATVSYTLSIGNDPIARELNGSYALTASDGVLTLSHTSGSNNLVTQQSIAIGSASYDSNSVPTNTPQKLNFDKFGLELDISTSVVAGTGTQTGVEIAQAFNGTGIGLTGKSSQIKGINVSQVSAGQYTFTATTPVGGSTTSALSMSWTDAAGNAQTESIDLAGTGFSFKDNTDSTIKFHNGLEFDVHSFQAQTGDQMAALISGLTDTQGTNAGVLNVTGSNNASLAFQSGAQSTAFININTINVMTGSGGLSGGSAVQMTTLGTAIDSPTGLSALSENSSDLATWQAQFKKTASLIDTALDWISTQRSVYGAQMNRLGFVSSNLSSSSTNLQNSRSAIMDTDFAAETAKLTKGQIMQQAATAMLAQANQMPNVILSLLK